MTFFKVNDPKNRELIKQVIAKRAVIREADRRRKMGDALEFEELSRFFKPITQQTEKTTERLEKGIGEIPGKIARVLPRPVNIQPQPQQPQQRQPRIKRQQSPPRRIASVSPQPRPKLFTHLEDKEVDSEDEKLDEAAGGEEEEEYLPKEVEKIGKSDYKIGEEKFTTKGETLIYKNEKIKSKKLVNVLTDGNYNVNWGDLNQNEKKILGKIIANSNILYDEDNMHNISAEKKKKKKIWRKME